MRLTKRQLQFLIQEQISLVLESEYVEGTVVTTSKTDNYEYKYESGQWKTRKKGATGSWSVVSSKSGIASLNGKFFKQGDSKSSSLDKTKTDIKKSDIRKASELGGALSTATRAIGFWRHMLRNSRMTPAVFLGIQLVDHVIQRVAPSHYAALMLFLSGRTSPVALTKPELRTAMHKVALRAKSKGRPIDYSDYYYAQPSGDRNPTYGFGLSVSDPSVDNPYGQLSVTFGRANFKENSDGTFTVKDKYDYNVYRKPGRKKEDIEEVIPSLTNYSKSFKNLYDGLVAGKTSKAQAIEPALVLYETSLDYEGYPVSIKTKV